jgi:hypothetical protein
MHYRYNTISKANKWLNSQGLRIMNWALRAEIKAELQE